MDNATIIGMVLIGLTSIVALFVTVGKPIIKLNTTITKFDLTLSNLSDDVKDYKKAVNDELSDLWQADTAKDMKITDHENRITRIEHIKQHKTTA